MCHPPHEMGMTADPQQGSVRRRRVLRVFSRLNIGGPSIHVVLLAAGLAQRGYSTQLVVGRESDREGDLQDFAREKGVAPIVLPSLGRAIRPLSDLQTLAALIRMIRSSRPGILHTHTAKAGVLGRLAALVTRVPVVVHTYHGHVLSGYFGPLETAFYRTLERGLARASDALVAVSGAVKRDLLGMGVGDDHKIRVIPLGLELASLTGPLPRGVLRAVSGVPTSAPLVGIVGRLVPIKDVPTFLEAARIIAEVCPDVRFAVVGDGEERSLLESSTGSQSLEGVVRFHGWQRDMRAVYGDLDVVVNCSRNEGTPVSLIEALAAGRPVVATAVGGTPDLLDQGRYGTLVPPADPKALAQAILAALAAPAAALARAEDGRRHVLARHSAERLIDDVDALYSELWTRSGLQDGDRVA
jgi:glycosyltransferase involved in cell wall biosynthesis